MTDLVRMDRAFTAIAHNQEAIRRWIMINIIATCLVGAAVCVAGLSL